MKRTYLIVHFLILLISFIGVGCSSYSVYQMDILRPADVTIPLRIKSVVVVDNSFHVKDSIAIDVDTNTKYVTYIPEWVDTASVVAAKELVSELLKRRFYDTVYYVSESLNGLNGIPYKSINKEQLYNFAFQKQAEGVIVLNNFIYKPELDYYTPEMEVMMICQQSLKASVEWMFYDAPSDVFIDNHIANDTMIWSGAIPGYIYPVPGLPLFADAVNELAAFEGVKYANRISPYWESVSRYYYPYSGGYFTLANSYVQKNKWDEAEKVWFHLYKICKGIRQSHMAHNIALAKEVQGNFKEAAEWSMLSWSLIKDRSSWYEMDKTREKSYYTEMAKRYAEANKLAKQVGVLEP